MLKILPFRAKMDWFAFYELKKMYGFFFCLEITYLCIRWLYWSLLKIDKNITVSLELNCLEDIEFLAK